MTDLQNLKHLVDMEELVDLEDLKGLEDLETWWPVEKSFICQ